jgi:Concanavalin A-like lectin/glucanases superfamily
MKNEHRKWRFTKPFFVTAGTMLIAGLLAILFGFVNPLKGLKRIDPPGTVIWTIKDTALVGGFTPVVLGAPSIVNDGEGTSISFDGIDDGFIIPINPVENWKQFTIEILFKPAADGPTAPRFMHFQDKAGNRGTIELRLTQGGQWYLDAFLKNGKTNKGLTLIDSTKLHPADQWYWAALVYDGKKMSDYVNAIPEHEGLVEIEPMGSGEISLGVRLNRINWFKGQIREIRFHPAVLDSKQLMRL